MVVGRGGARREWQSLTTAPCPHAHHARGIGRALAGEKHRIGALDRHQGPRDLSVAHQPAIGMSFRHVRKAKQRSPAHAAKASSRRGLGRSAAGAIELARAAHGVFTVWSAADFAWLCVGHTREHRARFAFRQRTPGAGLRSRSRPPGAGSLGRNTPGSAAVRAPFPIEHTPEKITVTGQIAAITGYWAGLAETAFSARNGNACRLNDLGRVCSALDPKSSLKYQALTRPARTCTICGNFPISH